MLRSLHDMRGFRIRATDDEVGSVHDVFLDDERWAVRYLVVETGAWLAGRQVLVSPMTIAGVDLNARELSVALTRAQIEGSPDVNTHQPISRQQEAEHSAYYGLMPYWGGPELWGAGAAPGIFGDPPLDASRTNTARSRVTTPPSASTDSHLQSARELVGYHILATDGEIGHIDDLLVDDRTWAVRYIEVDTSNWIGGTAVVVPGTALGDVDWSRRLVSVSLTRRQVEESPRLDRKALTAEAEQRLDEYYKSGVPS